MLACLHRPIWKYVKYKHRGALQPAISDGIGIDVARNMLFGDNMTIRVRCKPIQLFDMLRLTAIVDAKFDIFYQICIYVEGIAKQSKG